MKELIANILFKALKELEVEMKKENIEKLLEVPPSLDLGDYAFPCFPIAKILKENPHDIALRIRSKIKKIPVTEFDEIQTNGAYVNFFLERKGQIKKIIGEILTQKDKYGKSNLGKNGKIVVEFSSPNIAKPFGIGHLRSTIIGNSISNICNSVGYKTIKINYLGDWGTPFGRIIFGYKKFGDEKKLKKDPINHLFKIYVKTSKSIYDKQAREWFKKLEDGDKETTDLWRNFKKLSINELDKIYDKLGIEFDVFSGESEYDKKTDFIVKELKNKNLLKESEGAWIIDLEKYNLGILLIQKNDGTTLYATRDLAAAIDRYKKYKFKKMIYEVGQEQKFHFRQIFKVLELMGYEWAKDCVHVYHGLYLDKDGKKFSTRKGKTIFMEDIIKETTTLTKKEIKKRSEKISEKEINDRALKITKAAIFYGDLKNNRANNMVFDIKRFISFEGDTGPYLLYSYARASSILRKTKNKEKFKIYNLDIKEIELAKKLSEFPDVILKSFNHLNPSYVSNYSYQISKQFNEFYHACSVIGSKEEAFRLTLVKSFRQVLKNSLLLLGIDVLEKM